MPKTILSISLATSSTDTRSDVHAQQLLEEQFTSVRNLHTRNLPFTSLRLSYSRAVVAVLAVVCVVHRRAHQTAVVAHRHHVRVRRVEETLAHELRRAVGNQHITFHFSQTKTAVARTTFQGLTRKALRKLGWVWWCRIKSHYVTQLTSHHSTLISLTHTHTHNTLTHTHNSKDIPKYYSCPSHARGSCHPPSASVAGRTSGP